MSTSTTWPGLATGAWLLVTAGIFVHAFCNPFSHTVFNIYAPASLRWWQGEDIYVRLIDYFRYSPLFAILLTPFAALPDQVGCAVWKAFNIGVYAVGLRAAARHLVPRRLSEREAAAFLLLALPLSLHSMYNGQANLAMVGLVLLGLAEAARQRWAGAAAWLAGATLIKPWAVALPLVLMVLYPRRFAPRYALCLLTGLALPFATQPFPVVVRQYASWFTHLCDSTGLMRERNRSFDYLLACYRWPMQPQTYLLLEVLAGLGVLLGALFLAGRGGTSRPLLTSVLLLFSVWVALFGPATEACTYVILAPAVAWSVVEAFQAPVPWWRRGALLVSLFLMGPAVTDAVGPFRHVAIRLAAQPIGALLYLACFVTRKSPAQAAPGAAAAARARTLRAAA